MSDTSKDNMLGRLEGITEKLTELEIKVISTVSEEQLIKLKETKEKMTELINALPKKIYNFRKNDYIVCRDKLNEIMGDLKSTRTAIEKLNLGLESIKIITMFSSIEEEIQQCILKAESKANSN